MSWSWNNKPTPRKNREEKRRQYTEQIAYKLYQNRLLLNRSGDEQGDWKTAEKIVNNPLRTTFFICHLLFIKLEKRIWEPTFSWAENQALLSLLGVIGNAGLIIAVLMYVGSEKQRRDAEILNAWQTITNADGQPGNGGRIHALEFLNASSRNQLYDYPGANWRRRASCLWICTWPSESLVGIDLSAKAIETPKPTTQEKTSYETQPDADPRRVYLAKIQLPGADLEDANLEGANLSGANLESATLLRANLESADLQYANLEGTTLLGANLEAANLDQASLKGAILLYANLEGANLSNTNLKDASLGETNLKGANLSVKNLEGANLSGADLTGANLLKANLEGADLQYANLEGANLEQASLKGAELVLASLEGTDLSNANLKGANLSETNLEGANLSGADLTGANLLKANLEGANLSGANLKGTNLSGANLEGTELLATNLEDTKSLTQEQRVKIEF